MARTSNITEIDLARFNKWWFGDFLPTDPEITKYGESRFKWEPRTIKTFCDKDCIFTLRGPRRVGKTTLLKLITSHLLENGKLTESELLEEECPIDVAPVPPKNVFYFPCDYLDIKPFKGEDDLPIVIQT
jgi:predicted AAA+ superfamily ATPase